MHILYVCMCHVYVCVVYMGVSVCTCEGQKGYWVSYITLHLMPLKQGLSASVKLLLFI